MTVCKNVGPIDRGLRALIGIVALVIAFTSLGVMDGSIAGIIAAAVGAVMLLTAALGLCPLYVPIGLSTCKVK